MALKITSKFFAVMSLVALVGACGSGNGGVLKKLRVGGGQSAASASAPVTDNNPFSEEAAHGEGRTTIWDSLSKKNTGTEVKVNRYIWNASLEVLNFLPVQSVDPFSGVIVTGYGIPPGGGRSYRATIYVKDPALDARSLNLALQTRGGRAVSTGTTRAIEDAILARARQLRIADGKI